MHHKLVEKMTKRRIPIIIALALTLTVAFTGACNKSGGNTASSSSSSSLSPTDTLKAYYDAANKKDVAGIKKYLSQGTMKMMELGAKNSGKQLDEALKEAPQTPIPQFSNEKITGDTATVDITAGDQTMTMPLVKEGGEWKIAMDKFIEKLRGSMGSTTSAPPDDSKTDNTGNDNEGHEDGKP
ncbi:MAG: hypothetical protein QOH63_190 [Acidobacteriota bacterium]|jgi:hypothetical protein|nr:hypothetical protein [Acidobacteriota bacterium]